MKRVIYALFIGTLFPCTVFAHGLIVNVNTPYTVYNNLFAGLFFVGFSFLMKIFLLKRHMGLSVKKSIIGSCILTLLTTFSAALSYTALCAFTISNGVSYVPHIKYSVFFAANGVLFFLIVFFDGLLLRRVTKTLKESFLKSTKINAYIYLPALVIIVVIYSPTK